MDEAEAFAAKIQQLIDEYNIELSEIGNKPEETRVGSETLVLRTRQSWQKHFLIKLAKFYGCNAIKYRKSWLLVGTQIDRAIVAEFFEYFESLAQDFSSKALAIYRNTGEYRRKRKKQRASIQFRESYCFGFVFAIYTRIRREREQNFEQNSTALIFIGNKLTESNHWTNTNLSVRSQPVKRRKTRADAFNKGYSDGESVSLTTKTVS